MKLNEVFDISTDDDLDYYVIYDHDIRGSQPIFGPSSLEDAEKFVKWVEDTNSSMHVFSKYDLEISKGMRGVRVTLPKDFDPSVISLDEVTETSDKNSGSYFPYNIADWGIGSLPENIDEIKAAMDRFINKTGLDMKVYVSGSSVSDEKSGMGYEASYSRIGLKTREPHEKTQKIIHALRKILDHFNTDYIKEGELEEGAKMVWARSGNKVIRKYRCTSGKRNGRTVSSPSQCNAPIDIKKRQKMKQTRAAKGARMVRKARKTKRFNPASKRIQQMNKGR